MGPQQIWKTKPFLVLFHEQYVVLYCFLWIPRYQNKKIMYMNITYVHSLPVLNFFWASAVAQILQSLAPCGWTLHLCRVLKLRLHEHVGILMLGLASFKQYQYVCCQVWQVLMFWHHEICTMAFLCCFPKCAINLCQLRDLWQSPCVPTHSANV